MGERSHEALKVNCCVAKRLIWGIPTNYFKETIMRKRTIVLLQFLVLGLIYIFPLNASAALDSAKLADTCRAMESAIKDVTMEYEWFHEPPMTGNDLPRKMALSSKEPFKEHVLLTETQIVTNGKQQHYKLKAATAVNGDNIKKLQDGKMLNSAEHPNLNMTPLGFTVLRLSFDSEIVPLSERLRNAELVHIDNTIKKINDCNTIRADLLTSWNKQVCIKVYFSADNDYTPVRYEYMNGLNLAYTVDITSLKKVSDKLWFPTSGIIKSTDRNTAEKFKTISKIKVNNGIDDKVFDFKLTEGKNAQK